jgi:hypothetical protein
MGKVVDSDEGWAVVSHIFGVDRHAGICPTCKPVVVVGLDWATENVDRDGTLSDSIACAFAFHLGQYEDAAHGSGWDVPARLPDGSWGPIRWRDASFISPDTLGRYGWPKTTDSSEEVGVSVESTDRYGDAANWRTKEWVALPNGLRRYTFRFDLNFGAYNERVFDALTDEHARRELQRFLDMR